MDHQQSLIVQVSNAKERRHAIKRQVIREISDPGKQNLLLCKARKNQLILRVS